MPRFTFPIAVSIETALHFCSSIFNLYSIGAGCKHIENRQVTIKCDYPGCGFNVTYSEMEAEEGDPPYYEISQTISHLEHAQSCKNRGPQPTVDMVSQLIVTLTNKQLRDHLGDNAPSNGTDLNILFNYVEGANKEDLCAEKGEAGVVNRLLLDILTFMRKGWTIDTPRLFHASELASDPLKADAGDKLEEKLVATTEQPSFVRSKEVQSIISSLTRQEAKEPIKAQTFKLISSMNDKKPCKMAAPAKKLTVLTHVKERLSFTLFPPWIRNALLFYRDPLLFRETIVGKYQMILCDVIDGMGCPLLIGVTISDISKIPDKYLQRYHFAVSAGVHNSLPLISLVDSNDEKLLEIEAYLLCPYKFMLEKYIAMLRALDNKVDKQLRTPETSNCHEISKYIKYCTFKTSGHPLVVYAPYYRSFEEMLSSIADRDILYQYEPQSILQYYKYALLRRDPNFDNLLFKTLQPTFTTEPGKKALQQLLNADDMYILGPFKSIMTSPRDKNVKSTSDAMKLIDRDLQIVREFMLLIGFPNSPIFDNTFRPSHPLLYNPSLFQQLWSFMRKNKMHVSVNTMTGRYGMRKWPLPLMLSSQLSVQMRAACSLSINMLMTSLLTDAEQAFANRISFPFVCRNDLSAYASTVAIRNMLDKDIDKYKHHAITVSHYKPRPELERYVTPEMRLIDNHMAKFDHGSGTAKGLRYPSCICGQLEDMGIPCKLVHGLLSAEHIAPESLVSNIWKEAIIRLVYGRLSFGKRMQYTISDTQLFRYLDLLVTFLHVGDDRLLLAIFSYISATRCEDTSELYTLFLTE